MPTVAKSTSKISKLGDLSTYSVSASAIPTDTSDSSGALPTVNTTFVKGTDTEYLIGESLTLKSPAIGSYTGEIVNYSKARNSSQYTLSAESMLSRMNIDLRTYPLSDYSGQSENTYLPLYTLEYWTQQAGIFYKAVPGNVLFYQSLYGHFGAFAKNIVRPVRAKRFSPVSGGTSAVVYGYGGSIYAGLGRGQTSAVDFPPPAPGKKADAYLPVQVPTGTSKKLVFGVDVNTASSGNSGSVTWNMLAPNGTSNPLTLAFSADSGFTLQVMKSGVLTTILTAPAASSTLYSVYIGLNRPNTSNTTFSMRVVSSTGVVVFDKSTTTSTALSGSLSVRQITYSSNLGGSGNQTYIGNVFISLMSSLPANLLTSQKSLTLGYKGSAFMVGFSGNAWEHIKQYCSIYHLDVSYRDGKLVVGPRPKDVTVGASLSELNTTISQREKARNVEVVNQNHTPTGVTPQVLWKADSVYQVAVGEIQEFTVQTSHSILETSQPVCVSAISPFPYKSGSGQYVVTGSDGYIVSPTFWRDQGGKITTETTEVEGEIKVTIKGPDFDSPRAPYRISEGDAGRPALYITGQGVLADPETLKVGTGNGLAAKDVGVTINSPFIGNRKLAYDAAARAAKTFSAPEVSVSIAEPLDYDKPSKLGAYPAGSLVKHDGNTFRVKSAEQSPRLLSASTEQHNTIYQVNRSFGTGTTIKTQKTFYAGKTIGQVNIKPMKKAK